MTTEPTFTLEEIRAAWKRAFRFPEDDCTANNLVEALTGGEPRPGGGVRATVPVELPTCPVCKKAIADRPDSVCPVVCAKCQDEALSAALARRSAEPPSDAHPGHDPFFCHDGCPSYRVPSAPVVPIPMRIPCPDCGTLHIDEGEHATKPHHTHACQSCGLTWRPAVVHTVGVRFLPGFKTEAP